MLSQNAKYFSDLSAERAKRSSNFSIKEVKYLVQLVDRRKEIIESKKSDRATSEEKVRAWREIEKDFNSAFQEYRSFKVLKTKYDNLKKNVKRKMQTNLSNLSILKIMQSNDNAVTNEPLSDFDYDISDDENTLLKSNASDIDMKPLPPLNEEELDAAAEEYVFETLLFGDTQTSSSTAQQKAISTPRQELPEPIIDKTISTTPTVDVWEEVAHKKIKKLELEIKIIEEEWKLRKQKLELEVESVKIENRLKEENLKILKQKLQNNKINNNDNNSD